MTTVEAPIINPAPALPQGLEEIIYASVEKALEKFMANRRSHRRGEQGKKDLHSEGLPLQHQSEERGQIRFGGPRGHHGMKHGHHGMKHGHPGMKHGHPGIRHGHHGMNHGHHGMMHGHPGMRHGHHGMRHGHHGMRHGHPGMRHGHHGMRHGQRFSFLACGARPAEQQKEGEDKPVEVVDLVEQDKAPSAERELQKGIENMNVDDNAPPAESDKS